MLIETTLARAWADPDFKSRLIKDPQRVLAECGVATPEGVKIKVVEDTADTQYMVLPAAP